MRANEGDYTPYNDLRSRVIRECIRATVRLLQLAVEHLHHANTLDGHLPSIVRLRNDARSIERRIKQTHFRVLAGRR